MNDSLDFEGFFPSVLVFGEFPSTQTLENRKGSWPTVIERASLAKSIKMEMDSKIAHISKQRALCHSVSVPVDTPHNTGDQVLLYREKQVNNRIGEWVEPFIVKGCGLQWKANLYG